MRGLEDNNEDSEDLTLQNDEESDSEEEDEDADADFADAVVDEDVARDQDEKARKAGQKVFEVSDSKVLS